MFSAAASSSRVVSLNDVVLPVHPLIFRVLFLSSHSCLVPVRVTFPPPDNLLPDPPGRSLLHISRVSDAILNGEWWFAGQMGYLDKPYEYHILDANISVHVKYGHLEFGIPSDDLMTLHVDTGIATGACMDIHDPTRSQRPMFGMHFDNANGLGTATYNPHQQAVAMQISEWHLNQTSIVLDYPPVFLPEEFISDMLKHVINVSTEAANGYLYDHPYVLPQGFQAKAPNPVVHLRHQAGCCNNIHGFVEITSSLPKSSTAPMTTSTTFTTNEAASWPDTQAPQLFEAVRDDVGGSIRLTVYQHASNVTSGTHGPRGASVKYVRSLPVHYPRTFPCFCANLFRSLSSPRVFLLGDRALTRIFCASWVLLARMQAAT